MAKRDVYLNKLIKSMHNGLPKVVTGIRRCGKSYLLEVLFREYLQSIGVTEDQIIIIELDDYRNANYRNPIILGEYVREKCNGKEMNYVIIDEIQLVNTIINPVYTNGEYKIVKDNGDNTISFIDVILGLSREKNIDLYVIGSNSKMLSSDIVTEFRDKATNISIMPLSFEEYLQDCSLSNEEALYEYMQYGGMPATLNKEIEWKKEYLSSIFETTYFRDILE